MNSCPQIFQRPNFPTPYAGDTGHEGQRGPGFRSLSGTRGNRNGLREGSGLEVRARSRDRAGSTWRATSMSPLPTTHAVVFHEPRAAQPRIHLRKPSFRARPTSPRSTTPTRPALSGEARPGPSHHPGVPIHFGGRSLRSCAVATLLRTWIAYYAARRRASR